MDFADKTFDRLKFSAGSKIFEVGETAQAAFVVLSGEVEILGRNDKGDMVPFTVVKRGEMFGELALMQPDAKRTASAKAKTDCEVMTVGRETLMDKIDRADPFLRYWVRYLSDRVVDLSKRLGR